MALHADRERCQGAGMCALTAPDLFDQDPEDGRVVLRRPAPAYEAGPTGARAREAAALCPAGALTYPSARPGG
ncbi:ferredoxin [Streptomyces sp. DH12]|uniref:ferredoxin n=1 Tax=Streptomyces sp. DH12 TaxID=2857010 RepID=UPI001E5B8524|nr:ferredoxin [Streptomyces sp. DH12]